MKEERSMDARALLDCARASQTGEHFQELEKGTTYRVGVGARVSSPDRPSLFIEVIVNPCPGPDVDLSLMEENLSVLRELETRGYIMRCEDDGSIVCELLVSSEGIQGEHVWITALVEQIHPSSE
jgi:hypothetical protein